MKSFYKALTGLCLALFATAVLANQSAVCPDLTHVKAEGLTMAELIDQNEYAAYNLSMYQTDTPWGFVIVPLTADSVDMALTNGNQLLSTMSGDGIPMMDDEGNLMCLYDTGNQDTFAIAISNPDASMSKVRGFISSKK